MPKVPRESSRALLSLDNHFNKSLQLPLPSLLRSSLSRFIKLSNYLSTCKGALGCIDASLRLPLYMRTVEHCRGQ
jgi:hypothetical protein